jgi:hypothetical protein
MGLIPTNLPVPVPDPAQIKIRRNIDRHIAIMDNLMKPPWMKLKRRRRRRRSAPTPRDIIRAIAREEWPPAGKWQGATTYGGAVQRVANVMMARGMKVSSPNTFRRAFGLLKT